MMSTVSQMLQQFTNPDARFRMAPFWFLNHRLEKDELLWQIREMHRQGIGGFVLHARHGLNTPYMGADWMDMMEICVREAQRLGMVVYLYDENNWPSGAVDGQLLDKYPQHRMSGCVRTHSFKVGKGETVSQHLDIRDELITVAAYPTSEDFLADEIVDLTPLVSDGKLVWTADSDVVIEVFAREITRTGTFFGGYLDTLSTPAVEAFIELTHQAYYDRLGQWFGTVIQGIFTDEPSMNLNPQTHCAWTPELPAEFQWRKGYPVLHALVAMFGDSAGWKAQAKADFIDTVSDMYANAYHKTIHDWCDEHRIGAVGHVLYEGEAAMSARYQGDWFRTARWMHMGGCDLLCDMDWPEQYPAGLNNLLTPKLASSAAHLWDKPRVMCEAFGCGGAWSVNLNMLKRLADWLVVNGVNLIQPHAFYYSLQGFRKFECPPSEFYQLPFWPYYNRYADYVGRLCSVFTGAKHHPDIAVLFPSRSLWVDMAPNNTAESEKTAVAFEHLTVAIAQAGFDFDLVPDDCFEQGLLNESLESQSITASTGTYKALVLPKLKALSASTAAGLIEAIEAGSIVMSFGLPDILLDGADDDLGLLDELKAAFGSHANAVLVSDWETSEGSDLTQNISEIMLTRISPEIAASPKDNPGLSYVENLIHTHYSKGGMDIYLIANSSRDQTMNIDLVLPNIDHLTKWDAAAGEVYLIDAAAEGGRVTLTLGQAESVLLTAGKPIAEKNPVSVSSQPVETIRVDSVWDFRLAKPNCLPLTRWSMELGGGVMARDGVGWWNIFESSFRLDFVPDDLRIVFDGMAGDRQWRSQEPVQFDGSINGEKLDALKPGDYLDHFMVEQDIHHICKEGVNQIRISSACSLHEPAQLSHPPLITGAFSLVQDKGAWVIVPPPSALETRSWTDQGLPFYSGTGIYSTSFNLNHECKAAKVVFPVPPGDLAEVIINGISCGIAAWQPWIVDISNAVRKGSNTIEIRVASSLQNQFVLTSRPSGLLGPVEIEIY